MLGSALVPSNSTIPAKVKSYLGLNNDTCLVIVRTVQLDLHVKWQPTGVQPAPTLVSVCTDDTDDNDDVGCVFIIMIVTARTSQNFPTTICIDQVSLQETCPRPYSRNSSFFRFLSFFHYQSLLGLFFFYNLLLKDFAVTIFPPSRGILSSSTLPQVLWEGSSVSFLGYVLFPFDSVF